MIIPLLFRFDSSAIVIILCKYCKYLPHMLSMPVISLHSGIDRRAKHEHSAEITYACITHSMSYNVKYGSLWRHRLHLFNKMHVILRTFSSCDDKIKFSDSYINILKTVFRASKPKFGYKVCEWRRMTSKGVTCLIYFIHWLSYYILVNIR